MDEKAEARKNANDVQRVAELSADFGAARPNDVRWLCWRLEAYIDSLAERDERIEELTASLLKAASVGVRSEVPLTAEEALGPRPEKTAKAYRVTIDVVYRDDFDPPPAKAIRAQFLEDLDSASFPGLIQGFVLGVESLGDGVATLLRRRMEPSGDEGTDEPGEPLGEVAETAEVRVMDDDGPPQVVVRLLAADRRVLGALVMSEEATTNFQDELEGAKSCLEMMRPERCSACGEHAPGHKPSCPEGPETPTNDE